MIIPSLCVPIPALSYSFTHNLSGRSCSLPSPLAQQDSPPPWRRHSSAKGHCLTLPRSEGLADWDSLKEGVSGPLTYSRKILGVVDWLLWASLHQAHLIHTWAGCVSSILKLKMPCRGLAAPQKTVSLATARSTCHLGTMGAPGQATAPLPNFFHPHGSPTPAVSE